MQYIVLIYRKEKPLSTPHVGGKELQLAAFLSGFIFNYDGAGMCIFSIAASFRSDDCRSA